MEKICIGNLSIKKAAALAPMASVADRAYRQMAASFGACLTTSEMVSAKGLCLSNRKTQQLLTITEKERPMGIQLFGNDPYYMAKAVEKALPYSPDFIDINMGCPVPKVYQAGSGAALLNTPELAEELVKEAVKASDVPVTVKIRKSPLGDDATVDFAKRMESAGASALTIHGRTRAQMYRPSADWAVIKKIKDALKIPVFGNGDVSTPEQAKQMYEETGVDLVVIGRGSYGRPWLFSQIESYLECGSYKPDPPLEEQLKILKKHIELLCLYEGEEIGMRKARAQAMRYMKGFHGAAKQRSACANFTKLQDLDDLIEDILKNKNG